MASLGPALAVALLSAPVLLGLAGALAPAFGFLPALGGESLTLEHWRALFAQPGLWRSVAVSLLSGLATTFAALAVAMLFLAGAGGRTHRLLRRAVSPLLAAPHAATAFALAFLIAPSGWLARLVSPWLTGWDRPPDALILHDPWGLSMMLGLVVKETPFLLLMSLPALAQIDAAGRLRAARGLGYGPVAAWMKAVAPGLYPLIRLPVYAVLAYGSSAVDAALILGPTNPPPLSVLVLRWQADPDLAMRFVAAAGATLQLLVTLAALGLWRLGELAAARAARPWLTGGARRLCDAALARLGAALMGALALAAGLGLLGLALASFAGAWRFPDPWPARWSLEQWTRAAPGLAEPLANSLGMALFAAALSLALAVSALENETRRGRPAGPAAQLVLYLPLLTPQAAFLPGLAAAADSAGLRPGFWTAAFGHAVFVLPYVYLSLSEAYRRLDPRWERVARSLGAKPGRAFLAVRAPMLLTPLMTAAAVGFAVSVGLYLPTQLLAAGRAPTLATEAVALASGGDRRVIGVWAVMLAAPAMVGFALAMGVPRLAWRNRRRMLAP